MHDSQKLVSHDGRIVSRIVWGLYANVLIMHTPYFSLLAASHIVSDGPGPDPRIMASHEEPDIGDQGRGEESAQWPSVIA